METTNGPGAAPGSASTLPLLGHMRHYAKGTIVVSEGEPALSMYLIHESTRRVLVSDEDGREVELNTLGARVYFGELMLGSQVRTATVQTTTRAELTMIMINRILQDLAAGGYIEANRDHIVPRKPLPKRW